MAYKDKDMMKKDLTPDVEQSLEHDIEVSVNRHELQTKYENLLTCISVAYSSPAPAVPQLRRHWSGYTFSKGEAVPKTSS